VKKGIVKTGYRIFVSISREAYDFIDSYYADKKIFTEEDVEGEWNNFVEGLV
jgi:hypothetical protein